MQDKRKKRKAAARRQAEMRKRQRREEIYKKRRKRKRKKRQQERQRAEKRRLERECLRKSREEQRQRAYEEEKISEDVREETDILKEEPEKTRNPQPEDERRQQQKREHKQQQERKHKQRDRKHKQQEGEYKQRKKHKKGRNYTRRRRYGYRKRKDWVSDKIVKIAVLSLFLVVLYLYCRPKVVEELVAEAGSRMPEVSEFLMREYKDARFVQDGDMLIDMRVLGDYEIGIMISNTEYTSILHIVDTAAPTVETKDVQIFKDHGIEPMDFIDKIEDVTQTAVRFAEMPDVTAPGKQNVELVVTDEGGNETQVSAVMEVLEDLQPPVISGVEELTVAVGDSISYKKNVTVSDNYDENVRLEVDSSEVDLNTQGDYTVTYTARDAVGNVAEEETVVHVKPASVEMATEEMVNKKADEILQQITTADMSRHDVAKAIFNWVHGNVGWSDGTPKTNWIQGAYRGLFERRGDCYVYASTSKCLLTRAGIENMDIGFSTERRTHYWNLIDLGEGWYHFDATRRTDGKSFFYYKDAEIRAYSSTHNGSHAYNPADYPTIQ